jgi:alpha-ketoglutarate-dependent taurine dioxygenase
VDNHAAVTVWRPLLLRGALMLGRHATSVKGGDHEDGDDGRALLLRLTEHCLDESRLYTHEWAVRDVLIWDNEATLHRAVPGVSGTRRHLARTVIAALHGGGHVHRSEQAAAAAAAAGGGGEQRVRL